VSAKNKNKRETTDDMTERICWLDKDVAKGVRDIAQRTEDGAQVLAGLRACWLAGLLDCWGCVGIDSPALGMLRPSAVAAVATVARFSFTRFSFHSLVMQFEVQSPLHRPVALGPYHVACTLPPVLPILMLLKWTGPGLQV